MSVNFPKLLEMCKKAKRLTLYTTATGQWISAGWALYPLLNAPTLNEGNLRALYAIPQDVRVEETDTLPPNFEYADVVKGETPAMYERIQLAPVSNAVCLRTKDGVTFIDSKYLRPLESGKNGESVLYERVDANGHVYIVAKSGMMLDAILLPMRNVIRPDWLDDLQELLSTLRRTHEQERDDG